jgi:hypothetical protein
VNAELENMWKETDILFILKYYSSFAWTAETFQIQFRRDNHYDAGILFPQTAKQKLGTSTHDESRNSTKVSVRGRRILKQNRA